MNKYNNCLYSIQDFLAEKSKEELIKIVVELAAHGAGSLEYVKDAYEATQDSHSVSSPIAGCSSRPEWCMCNVCQEMPTEDEEKCCNRKKCVTSYAMFKKICLDKDVLVMNIRARCDVRADDIQYTTNNY